MAGDCLQHIDWSVFARMSDKYVHSNRVIFIISFCESAVGQGLLKLSWILVSFLKEGCSSIMLLTKVSICYLVSVWHVLSISTFWFSALISSLIHDVHFALYHVMPTIILFIPSVEHWTVHCRAFIRSSVSDLFCRSHEITYHNSALDQKLSIPMPFYFWFLFMIYST